MRKASTFSHGAPLGPSVLRRFDEPTAAPSL